MSLTPGARLGVYDITAQIGEGGMGQVFRATDTRLKRQVAIKILPPAVTADAERLARFQREAEVVASLNHPDIAAIYGLEEGGGMTALVMELVEGDDLSQRIARGAIPIDEALPIARQIAEALDAAHEQGIVHRDLKPANIKVRADGTVKVLDFGLAKVTEPAGASSRGLSMSPTLSNHATQAGLILGTAAYMSPEQAAGKPVDKRSDVWSFGVVLHEMLSGQRTFKGDDIADTLAAVLRQDVDWTALPAATPASVRHLLGRCLDRDVKQRLRDIGEARIALSDSAALSLKEAESAAALAPSRPPRTMWRRAIPAALAAIVAAALAGTAAWQLKVSPPVDVTRLSFTLPEGRTFPGMAYLRRLLALSPDGKKMVYVGEPSGLYLRSMSQLDVNVIPGTEGYTALTDPVFSPDNQHVAFYAQADQKIKRIAVTGGAAVTICPVDNYPYGISWEQDGTILFGQGSKGIMRVSENGGVPAVLVRVKDGEVAHGPHLLPGRQHVLFTLGTGNDLDRWDKARIVVQSLTSGEPTPVIEPGSDARYLQTGHVVYALGGVLYARAFDVERLTPTGPTVSMVKGVRRSAGGGSGAAQFSVSNTGSLIYLPGPASTSAAALEIALFDRKGKGEPLKLSPGPYLMPRVSPDGTRIAFGTDDGKEANVYTYALSGATGMQFLAHGRFPIWTSDSKSVAFQSDREGDLAIWRAPAGGGQADRLTRPEAGDSHEPESWSPKSDALLFSVTKGSDLSLRAVSLLDRKPDGTPVPFGDVQHSLNPIGAVFSPDGRWVAYTRSERARTTIYVREFPTGTASKLVANGADNPHMVVWSPDGTELFYDPRPTGFEAVSVTTKPTFAFGNPVPVPKTFQLGPGSQRRNYDIVQSGPFAGRFLGLVAPGQAASTTPTVPQIQVVLNWFEELKRLVPTK